MPLLRGFGPAAFGLDRVVLPRAFHLPADLRIRAPPRRSTTPDRRPPHPRAGGTRWLKIRRAFHTATLPGQTRFQIRGADTPAPPRHPGSGDPSRWSARSRGELRDRAPRRPWGTVAGDLQLRIPHSTLVSTSSPGCSRTHSTASWSLRTAAPVSMSCSWIAAAITCSADVSPAVVAVVVMGLPSTRHRQSMVLRPLVHKGSGHDQITISSPIPVVPEGGNRVRDVPR